MKHAAYNVAYTLAVIEKMLAQDFPKPLIRRYINKVRPHFSDTSATFEKVSTAILETLSEN